MNLDLPNKLIKEKKFTESLEIVNNLIKLKGENFKFKSFYLF